MKKVPIEPVKSSRLENDLQSSSDGDEFDGSDYNDEENVGGDNSDEDGGRNDEGSQDYSDDVINSDESGDEDDEFEIQSSDDESDEDSELLDGEYDQDIPRQQSELLRQAESNIRRYREQKPKGIGVGSAPADVNLKALLNTDDLSSDDEDATRNNTVGRIPLHWYDAYDHIGYNMSGEKLLKRKGGDRIDQALSNRDESAAMRTVYDMYNDREVVLTQRDIEIIQRIQSGAFAHPEHDDTPDYVDYFSSIKEVMPLSSRPIPKQQFLPNKWEMLKVKKILHAMKEGTYKTIAQREEEKRHKSKPPLYMIWEETDEETLIMSKRNQYHLPAPKMPLPGHAESYNPSPEYLLTEGEQKDMEEQDPTDRQYNFIPKKFDCLRHVPGYGNLVKERFERCLDLYLCPRKLKLRLNIDPETLVPRLPKPRELQPYPNSLCLQYLGHTKGVRSISISPDGQYIVSGSDDCTVRLWEVDTCLCRDVWKFDNAVVNVAWNPHYNHHIVAVATGNKVVFISTGTGDKDSSELSDTMLEAARDVAGSTESNEQTENSDVVDLDEDVDEVTSSTKKKKVAARWSLPPSITPNGDTTREQSQNRQTGSRTRYGFPVGPAVEVRFDGAVTSLAWHHKGDYIATVAPTAGAAAVCIHQLSKGNSQQPFSKSPGSVQAVSFHPSRPYLFVTTQQHVRLYHLVEQQLVKKLLSGCKWHSSIDVHPSGDHIIVGSYDRRLVWFDLDLASTPFKTLKFHEKALRSVQYHRRYPLMASASDDGTVHIFHSTVYSDLSRSPLIVPLKVLRGHGVIGGVGVHCVCFHPRQPWVFSSGADSVINLYQNI